MLIWAIKLKKSHVFRFKEEPFDLICENKKGKGGRGRGFETRVMQEKVSNSNQNKFLISIPELRCSAFLFQPQDCIEIIAFLISIFHFPTRQTNTNTNNSNEPATKSDQDTLFFSTNSHNLLA